MLKQIQDDRGKRCYEFLKNHSEKEKFQTAIWAFEGVFVVDTKHKEQLSKDNCSLSKNIKTKLTTHKSLPHPHLVK